jgi:hypothetical protein
MWGNLEAIDKKKKKKEYFNETMAPVISLDVA